MALTTIIQKQAFQIAAMDYNKDIHFIIQTWELIATLYAVDFEKNIDICIGSFYIEDLTQIGKLPNVDFD